MRLVVVLVVVQAMGLLSDSSCEGFSFQTSAPWRTRSFSSALRVGTWDNDDFLESLSGKNPQSSDNDDEIPSDSIPGAELTADMREKIKKQQQDEPSGGGKMFKEMMEKAQSRKGSSPERIEKAARGLENPFAANPFAGIEGLDPDVTPQDDDEEEEQLALDPDALTVEQQAQLFRAMLKGQAPTTRPNAKPSKTDRLKKGRNKDADTIQNTADVYFAQLKRDSTVRGVARLRGDDQEANAVFKDEKIEELKGLIKENPHLA
jgi:hypothetical protein